MANNNDDDFDIDPPVPDAGGDNGPAGGGPLGGGFGNGKPSLREMWEGSPALKLAAIVLGGVVAVGGYMMFAPDEADIKSMVRISGAENAKQIPGREDPDPQYRKALEDANQKAAEIADQTGISALPTPIGTSKTGGLDMPGMPDKPKFDPLAEWRKATEARRLNPDKPMVEDVPEVVPMVQPIRPQQPAVKQDPNAGKYYVDQMRTILGAQAPSGQKAFLVTKVVSDYSEMMQEINAEKIRQAALQRNGTMVASDGTIVTGDNLARDLSKTIVPAGSIAYSQLLNEINSDVAGPVLVHILSGPFAGGRAIGQIEMKEGADEAYIVITFNRVVKDAVSYKVSGIAMDEKTTLTGQATEIDHHYLTRIILPAAGKFVQGYGSALSQTGSRVTQTAGGGQAVEQDPPNPKQSIYKGVEDAAQSINEMLDKNAQRPVTVKIAKGTTMGLLFLDSVTTKDVGK